MLTFLFNWYCSNPSQELNQKTGTDGEETTATWPFHAAMDEALGMRASINPINLFASGSQPSSSLNRQPSTASAGPTADPSTEAFAEPRTSTPARQRARPEKQPGKRKRCEVLEILEADREDGCWGAEKGQNWAKKHWPKCSPNGEAAGHIWQSSWKTARLCFFVFFLTFLKFLLSFDNTRQPVAVQ